MKLRDFWIPYLIVALIAVVLPNLNVGNFILLNVFLFFIYLSFISMWNLLAGYSGMISLGQPAFIGIAGYVLGVFSLLGLNTFLGIMAGGAAAAFFALSISVPVFKMRGAYAIGTAIVAELLRLFFTSFRPTEAEAASWGEPVYQ